MPSRPPNRSTTTAPLPSATAGVATGLVRKATGPVGSTPDSEGQAGETMVLKREFADPAREFGFMPLWFWNDHLTPEGIEAQITEFYRKGFGGFVLHPRNGLSRRIGYLTPEYFRLVRVAVAKAADLKMKVVLYDEAGYPAGSARGLVVAENPDWAAKCIFPLSYSVKGPAKGFWRPNPGRALGVRMVSVVAGREIATDSLDPDSLHCLEWDDHELVSYDLPEGNWRMVAIWEGHSGGTIRGAFEEEEDEHALAPPAADILCEDAVACFIRLTHDEYHAHLKEYFGTTVVAMFTDEPTPMGRISDPELRATRHPWTPGFLEHLQPWWDEEVRRWLPALWLDCGPRTSRFRGSYGKAVKQRLEKSFYQPISAWCLAHDIALTGHSASSNEMGNLRNFQWPGQDQVWRTVIPGSASALQGAESLTAKAACSAARLSRRRFNTVEIFGAYGWELTLDEVKWLLDWHFVRGTNLVFPHAAYYSLRGRRAFESEPDVAIHNPWWPYFGLIGDYGRRLCWLLTDGEPVCETGIVSDGDALAWTAASLLHPDQRDFVFVDSPALEVAEVVNGRLMAGMQALKLLIVDQPGILSEGAARRLDEFEAAGGVVLRVWTPEDLTDRVAGVLGREVEGVGHRRGDLRAMPIRKRGLDFLLLVNEGEETLDGQIHFAGTGRVELWDARDGSTRPWPSRIIGPHRLQIPLRLNRRESAVFSIDPKASPEEGVRLPAVPGKITTELRGLWTAKDRAGRAVDIPCPGDWAQTPGWETFSGTICFHTTFELPADQPPPRFVDLGRVGDIAEVRLNNRLVGVRTWAPYILDLGGAGRPGTNRLEVRITNSMANAYNGRQMPSGLLGPVCLRAC